jgi:hypothetical protein
MLYTFIMDFRAGNYISQVEGTHLSSAIRNWASKLDISSIEFLGEAGKQEIISHLNETETSEIRGL